MNEKLPYCGAVLFSSIALVLLVINVSLATVNRAAQMEINQRQATLAAGQQLSQLNQGLVQMMAEAAIKNNNTKLRDLLTAQGITLKSEPASVAKSPEKSEKK